MGIKFFKKSIYDLSNTIPVTTITDSVATSTGQDYVDLMRNRDDDSGWSTTDSTDAANTTIEINFVDLREFDRILILNHNLKAYTIQYWNGSSYVNFSTPVNVTSNTSTSTFHVFNKIFSSRIRIVITGTMVADSDKSIRQLLVCENIGEFSVQPHIKPVIDRDRQSTKYLSGKTYVSKSSGGLQCMLQMDTVSNENDLALAETIFDSYEGVLMWLSGGDLTQYETVRLSYRLQDIYLVQCANEYEPEWNKGRYAQGMELKLKLVEIN